MKALQYPCDGAAVVTTRTGQGNPLGKLITLFADARREPCAQWPHRRGSQAIARTIAGRGCRCERALVCQVFACRFHRLDAPMLPELLDQIAPDQEIGTVSAS